VRRFRASLVLLLCSTCVPTFAAEKLVLDVNVDTDLLSMTHHIAPFPFQPTLNFALDQAGNLSERFRTDVLENHLATTALVRIDGEVAGFATEQELVGTDSETGKLRAESAWLFTLNHPRARGFLAVRQRENPTRTFAVIQQVLQNPDAPAADEEMRILSTDGDTFVQLATDGLSAYQGGRFEEYNIVNPAGIKRDKRPRGRILEFVIYPAR
jgi:hypothetical protein